MCLRSISIFLLLSFSAPAYSASESEGLPPPPPGLIAMINADRVNLRSAADTNSEVVTQLDYGHKLALLDVQDDWVKVRPPEDVLFWVHSGLIRDGRVATRILNVRSGSSVNYAVLGQLERNATVEVVTTRAEWLGIRPPEGMGLWVYRELVELPPPPKPPISIRPVEPVQKPVAPKPSSPPVPVSSTPKPVAPTVPPSTPTPPPAPPPPPPPADLNLVPLDGQGTLSSRTGILRAYLLTAGKPSRYRLTPNQSAGIEQAICMVKGDDDELRRWLGRKVSIRGRDYWVKDEKMPVMVIESIGVAEPTP